MCGIKVLNWSPQLNIIINYYYTWIWHLILNDLETPLCTKKAMVLTLSYIMTL